MADDDLGDDGLKDDAVDDQPLALAAEADQYRFGHSCPLCGTRMDFVSSQIGSSTACPDCFTTFVIPTPNANQERRPLSADGFGAPDRLNMEAPAADAKRLDSPDALKSSADRLLEQAAKQLAEERRDKHEGQFSDAAAASLFQFLLAPGAILRYLVLVAFGTLAFAILANVPAAMQEGGEGMKAAIWFLMASPLLLAWSAALSAHALALVRETSARVGPVEAWPSGNPFEWLGDLIHLGLALLVAGLPGFILASLLAGVGLSGILVGLAVPISLVILLPLVLISMLHEQSLFAVFSRDIFAGLTSFRSEVVTFYQASALLGIIVWMTLIGSGLGLWYLALPQAAILTLAAFLYFRLLGWLARALLTESEE